MKCLGTSCFIFTVSIHTEQDSENARHTQVQNLHFSMWVILNNQTKSKNHVTRNLDQREYNILKEPKNVCCMYAPLLRYSAQN